jgi:1-acylglycerone phosphate reductase
MTDRKTCLVTGCSKGGVGVALAEAFKDKGYHVFATARSPAKVPQALHADPHVTVLSLDVTSCESITAAAVIVSSQTGGKLDILINNAGQGLNMPALDTSIEEAKKLFDANFFGVLEMVQAFRHMLIKAKGVIVNNSSVGAYQPFPFISMYFRQKKAFLIRLQISLAN